MKRFSLYALANLAFLVFITLWSDGAGLAYLCPLFALCSTALLVERPLNGPYSILCLFLAIYFIFYGLQDTLAGTSEGGLTEPEIVILIGGALAVLGYILAVAMTRPQIDTADASDWRPATVVIVGLLLWGLGSYAAWVWSVDLITDTKNTTAARALGSISGMKTTLLMLGQMAKPLGMLMIAYAQTVYRRPYLLPILVFVVVFQLFYGFVVDIKGEAMIGVVLVLLTKVFVHARVPKAWLTVGVVFVVVAFPVFQAHRVISGARHIDHAETAQNLGRSISLALEASTKESTARRRQSQNFFERASLKASVQVIVTKTGDGVEFQQGNTLTPLLATFIPKILWRDKPDLAVGQLMNSEFHISEFRDTYISPSHLGELYWNFGWLGVLLGMPVIGFVFGTVGARSNLADRVSLTRLMIMVVTIRYIVMGFEGSIAVSYVVWLRSLAGIGLLHLLMERRSRHSQDELAELGQTRTVSVP